MFPYVSLISLFPVRLKSSEYCRHAMNVYYLLFDDVSDVKKHKETCSFSSWCQSYGAGQWRTSLEFRQCFPHRSSITMPGETKVNAVSMHM